ncbi:MAG: cysteine hydrolase family protein [Pseudomonadota bacterium]
MTTALLVVDMQVALVKGAFNEQDVLNHAQQLISLARAASAPVIFVQHCHASFEPMKKGSAGWEVHPQLEPQATDLRLEKEASDAFYGTSLAETLRERGVTQVVICGMMTEFCVDATARSALSHDFDVILARDAHTTGDSTLSAAEIIAHHNSVLPAVVHPSKRIKALPSSEVAFT